MSIDRRDFLAAGLLLGGSQLQSGEPAGAVEATIADGFLSAAGVSASGWYAGAIILDQGEGEFCRGLSDPERWACRYDNTGFEAEAAKAQLWRAKIRHVRERLIFRSAAKPSEDVVISSADRILGPATPRTTIANPALVWTERSRTGWALKLFDGRQTHVIHQRRTMLRRPVVESLADSLIVACETELDGRRQVELFSQTGAPLARMHGGRPRLASGNGRLFVLLETATTDSVTSRVVEFNRKLQMIRELPIPGTDDYTWKGDLVVSQRDRKLIVVAESCPAFGQHEQLALTKDLLCWSCGDGETDLKPIAGNNRLPASCEAAAVEPRLFASADAVYAAWRQYRVSRARGSFGWDVLLTKLDGDVWQAPLAITPNYGTADTGFDLLFDGNRTLGVFPCRSHQRGGHITDRYWTEVREIPPRPAMRRSAPSTRVSLCNQAKSFREISIEPQELRDAPAGLHLIWADLHRHSTYSTCQAPTNGSPEEHLRFVRDVLGCQVMTLTEHGHHMTGAESIYTQDRVEEYAGDRGIVLYADEPNPDPGRHTNFYTTHRDTFAQLRTIFLSHGRARADVYRHIRKVMPKNSVLAISHFHGKPLTGEAMRASYDPNIDVAMEAMQIRGNVMLDLHRESSGLLFPNDCLDLGLRMALVGGTDHTFATDIRANHYCLTGLWVREASAEGVFEALRARRTTAMSNGKIAIWATLNGKPMGSDVQWSGGPVRIETHLSCARTIRRVGLLRDGKMLGWTTVGEKSASLTLADPEPSPGAHWYVVTAEMETAFPTRGLAHASPFYITLPGGPGVHPDTSARL